MFTSVRLQIAAVFVASVAKKPHIRLNWGPVAGYLRSSDAALQHYMGPASLTIGAFHANRIHQQL
jgi:hypothetical protein